MGEDGDTDADPGIDRPSLDLEWGLKSLQDAECRSSRCPLAFGAIKHYDKLVTTQPGKSVSRSNTAREPVGHLSEETVAEIMSLSIVDVLEIIEVEEKNRD